MKNSPLCFNCFSHIHDLRSCDSKSTCRKCNQRHHTLLHYDKQTYSHPVSQLPDKLNAVATPTVDASTPSNSRAIAQENRNLFSALSNHQVNVLLLTAQIQIKDKWGNYQSFRAFLGSGSQSSLITQKAVKRLGLSNYSLNFSVQGLYQTPLVEYIGDVTFYLKSLKYDNDILTVDAIVLNNICNNLPSSPVNYQNWSKIRELDLADPKFFIPAGIDVLLGADIFGQILLNNHLSGNAGEPDALETIFGCFIR